MPLPDPELAVTVYVSSAPVTPVTAGVPPRPVPAIEKSVASTPVTAALNVTVQCTLPVVAVGDGSLRASEETYGGGTTTTVTFPLAALAAVQVAKTAVTR